MKQNIKVRSGNRIVVKFDGEEVGLVQSVRMSDSFGLDRASGIGDIHVQEHVPTMAQHTLNVSTMVMKKANLRNKGIIPKNGDEVLNGNVFDIVQYDKDSGQIVRKYIDCSYDSGDIEITKHAIVVTNAVFFALDVDGDGA